MLRDNLEFFTATFAIIFAIAAASFGLVMAERHISFPAEYAMIEQLRNDSQHIDVNESEDVIGQITQTNQMIASKQAYNRVPIISWTVPDQWDDVEPIAIPERN